MSQDCLIIITDNHNAEKVLRNGPKVILFCYVSDCIGGNL